MFHSRTNVLTQWFVSKAITNLLLEHIKELTCCQQTAFGHQNM